MPTTTGLVQRTRHRFAKTEADQLTTPEPTPIQAIYSAPGPFGGAPFTASTDDGITLRGAVRGEGPIIVLSHCWTGSRNVWATVANSLVAAGHRVVVYDQRGHGLSDESLAPPTIERLAKDLTTVMDRLEIESAVIAGHSLGGMTALQQVIDRPERVKALALVSTCAGHLHPRLSRIGASSALGWVLATGFAQRLIQSPVGWALTRPSLGSKPPTGAVETTLDGLRRTSAHTRGIQMKTILDYNLVDRLPEIDVAVHVLVGSRDTLTPVWYARTMHNKIAKSKRTTYAKAGHMLPLERPDEVFAAIAELARAQEASRT